MTFEGEQKRSLTDGVMRFDEWFRMSVARVYAERIPTTIQYLCRKLEMQDPWVDFLIESMHHKAQMLS